jgi:hypothetical protein
MKTTLLWVLTLRSSADVSEECIDSIFKKPAKAGGKLNRKLTSRLKAMLAIRFLRVQFVLILDPGDGGG